MALRARQTGAAKAGRNAARRNETLTAQAYRLIEEQIVTLRLKPGDVLSEQMLSATFDIGRTPIREALQRLAREGLITVLPRKAFCVRHNPAVNCSFSKSAAKSSGYSVALVPSATKNSVPMLKSRKAWTRCHAKGDLAFMRSTASSIG